LASIEKASAKSEDRLSTAISDIMAQEVGEADEV
jgi:hypothetical protein